MPEHTIPYGIVPCQIIPYLIASYLTISYIIPDHIITHHIMSYMIYRIIYRIIWHHMPYNTIHDISCHISYYMAPYIIYRRKPCHMIFKFNFSIGITKMISCYIISYRITTWISSTTNPPGRTALSIWHSPFVLSLWPAVQPALESATTTTSSYSEQTSKQSRTRRNPESSTCSSESRLGVRETVFEVRRRHILPE